MKHIVSTVCAVSLQQTVPTDKLNLCRGERRRPAPHQISKALKGHKQSTEVLASDLATMKRHKHTSTYACINFSEEGLTLSPANATHLLETAMGCIYDV